MALRLLHFADAHIDMANYGRRDPASGLPQRVVDYLDSLDQIVNTAIEERVDLVLFAGDAYKDRNPQPTFQRAWGERVMRLSRAGIPTMLLIGNHDIAPAEHRAHTLQEFDTLAVPHLHVADSLKLWGPAELGIPVQVITIPWITRSRFLARQDLGRMKIDQVTEAISERITDLIKETLDNAIDPSLPLILTAHVSVQGARYGTERRVMLGQDLVLSPGLVSDARFDYVALGHIHKHQVLNEKPPVIYAGSIERIDFGEAREDKGFIVAEVERGHASWEFRKLKTRPFVDRHISVTDTEGFMAEVIAQLPNPESVREAICRVTIEFPANCEPQLDEKAIRDHLANAFEIKLVKNRLGEERSRLPGDVAVESLTPLELLVMYWQAKKKDQAEIEALTALANEVLSLQPGRNVAP